MISLDGNDKRYIKIEEIKKNKGLIYVYGGGATAHFVATYLRDSGIENEIKFVVDDEFMNKNSDCLPFSKFINKKSNGTVMVFGFYNYKIITEKKRIYGDKIKFYDFHFTRVGGDRVAWDKSEVEENIGDYEATWQLLHDDFSKLTMELYLRAAVNGEFDELYKKCHVDTAYFNDLTKSLDIEVLLDCGAYDGDSIHDFVKLFNDYNKVIAFEPDAINRNKLNLRIKQEKINNVDVLPFGAWSSNTTLYFSEDGVSSAHFADSGVSVSVITIDEVLKNFDGNIFIKMDIEGSEMNALQGATNTIEEKHPAMAICVYHKEKDLIDIPKFIHTVAGDGVYNYYLRFHGLDLSELVFYALPKS